MKKVSISKRYLHIILLGFFVFAISVQRNDNTGLVRNAIAQQGSNDFARERLGLAVFSPDGNTIASANSFGQVSLWDVLLGQTRLILSSQSETLVDRVIFSPNGDSVVGVSGNSIQVWDNTSGDTRFFLSENSFVKDLVFSPNGKILAWLGEDSVITLRDSRSGSVTEILTGLKHGVNAITFSPDSSILAAGSQRAELILFDVATGLEHSSLSVPDANAVTNLSYSPDGKTLASMNDGSNITLWNPQTISKLHLLNSQKSRFNALAFSPDNSILATGSQNGEIKLWDVAKGLELASLTGEGGAAVTDLEFSPDGKALVSVGESDSAILWDVSNKQQQILTGHTEWVVEAAFSSSQKVLASVDRTGEVIVWDLRSGEEQLAFQTPFLGVLGSNLQGTAFNNFVEKPSITGDSDQGLSNGSIQTLSRVAKGSVASQSAKPLKVKKNNRDRRGVTALASSPNGKLLGGATKDGNVWLWDSKGNKKFALPGHHGAAVTGIVFSADGKRLVSVGRDTEIQTRNVANGKKGQTLFAHEHPIRTIAASPDGKFFASAGEETRIMLWNARTGKLANIFSGHKDFVNSVNFSADGSILASGGADGRILLWNVTSGKLVQTLLGHAGEINTVTFSRDGRLLASGSSDSRVILWNATTREQIQSFAGHQSAIRALAFSPNSKKLVSAGEDAKILVWNTGPVNRRNVEPANLLDKQVVTGTASTINTMMFDPRGKLITGSDDGEITEVDIDKAEIKQIIKVPTGLQSSKSDTIPPLYSYSIQSIGSFPASKGKTDQPISTSLATVKPANIFYRMLDWLFPSAEAALPDPNQGPGGPILVVTNASNPIGKYYAEILRTEGFNSFAVSDISTIDASVLSTYDVVILAEMTLSSAQVTMLTDWVTGGGNLVAMRPDSQLASLLGLSYAGSTLAEGYLLVNSTQPLSNGIGVSGQPMQFHGVADKYTLNGATSIATLYSSWSTPTPNPAVTLRSVGSNGGQAAAFTYDLSTSIIYTRQGNPAWESQERDGLSPIRSDDKFYGNASGDPQPDWVDLLNEVAVPQADEQQRLLANLILQMNLTKKPLPRFWYFPHGKKAVVIMTGDDHANNGTEGRFDQFIAMSPAGCSVADWECVRGTSYIYPNTPLTDAKAAAYSAAGFEIGLHVNTSCGNFTPTSLETFYAQQISDINTAFPSVPAPVTQRHHCLVWSDWVTGAQVQLNHGIRLDTSFYFWPPSWVNDRPGFFTGSAIPMRFADLNGNLVDVYNAVTHMTDESGQSYPFTIDTLLDRALGAEGYYGAYTINAHTDLPQIPEATDTVNSAQSRGVPIVSSAQMLSWLDARNNSSFGSLTWNGSSLSFVVTPATDAIGLKAMLPINSDTGTLTGVTGPGNNIVPYSVSFIKGIQYAFFDAAAGSYTANYSIDTTLPTVISTAPLDGASDVNQQPAVSATFSEAIDPVTVTATTFLLQAGSNPPVSGIVSYNANTQTAELIPSTLLSASTLYTATMLTDIKDLAGNALAAPYTWTFTTGTLPCSSSPCSAWSDSDIPSTPTTNDPNSVELGVKFRSDLDGFVTGIRFYKGSTNTGTHTGNLWTESGAQLATAIFVNETASGWQQVNFSTPVAITANTTYVASYHAPNGNYATTNAPAFATQGVDNPPIRLLQDGVSGGNGVYAYSPSTTFPINTFNSSNYWVDVVFTTNTGSDTTPPTVTVQEPLSGANGVATNSIVTATFSEPMDASTVTASTFELRGPSPGNALIPASVSYDGATRMATLVPTSTLLPLTLYTAAVKGGTTDPRVKDTAGNALVTDTTWTFTTADLDTTPPTVTSTLPANGTTGVDTTNQVTVTFSEAVDASTVISLTFELRGPAPNNPLIPATVSYNTNTLTATLIPSSALSPATVYTATVKGGTTDPRVKDTAGNALATDSTWTFTTAVTQTGGCSGATNSIWPADPTPSVVADPDTSSIELGVKFRSSEDGYICGIRFYKGSSTNTGTHVGTLWSNTGALLASATFQNESASGWQQVDFGSPIAITANVVYVASYLAPNGQYSVDENYFTTGVTSGPLYAFNNVESSGNGVFQYGTGGFPANTFGSSNYWVDVVFTTTTGPDTTPPTVTSTLPVLGATGVDPANQVSVTFSEAIDGVTIDSSTFNLVDPTNLPVPATVAYDASTRTAMLTPVDVLAATTLYSATVKSGTSGVKDLAGNPLAVDFTWSFTTGVDPCSSGGNPIVCENSNPGNPPSEWDVSGAGDASIQGFTTDISVNLGETVRFKIDTPSTDYRLDIYRMGYYGGNGARKVETVQPSAALPQNQPSCLSDSTTGLIDCGNWAESASWSVPSDATSGIYFAKAVREDGANVGKASHIVFVVRDDAGNADLLFQTSDTTWQAYNSYGGNNFYTGLPAGRAYKLSYNRPFNTRSVDNGQDWVFNAEYPMVRWLEANGYNVSYFTGVDSDRRGNLIGNHKAFLSIGHDEYWSGTQRTNVETARDQGVHLAFFSGNEVFWKTRWENSIDGLDTAYRTLVCYKETHANAKIDPSPEWTGTWRDPRFSPPADGGRPENALMGTIFTVNDGATTSIQVPAADGKMRFWRNTSAANLTTGATETLPDGTLGYEWDEDLDNGFRPDGLIRLSTTTVTNAPILTDYGSTFGSGTAIHALTLYRSNSGALVFGGGTVQWPWGLDSNHDRGGTATSVTMKQATVNLFADMGIQPETLQSGLQAATASTDTTPPSSTITSPTAGTNVQPGSQVTISGTASDVVDGKVGGVEVSIDGGLTWNAAIGRSSWTYQWTAPNASATVTIKSRAVDDSLNMEISGAGTTVNVGSGPDTTPPTVTDQNPAAGSSDVATSISVTATFSEAMDAATISTSTFELRDTNNTLVPATVTYNSGTNTAVLTPDGALAGSATYTAVVKGGSADPRAKDVAGNALVANITWSFTTATAGSSNCTSGTNSIWPSNPTPSLITDPDASSIELGVKFNSTVDGVVCGIRFYKGATNTGTHIGKLWSSTGELLASATFENETASGWQQVNFASPVAIAANVVYVASYLAPVGQYSVDQSYFVSGVSSGSLNALSSTEGAGNGVYQYGTGGFPASSYQASNYWVDVVFK